MNREISEKEESGPPCCSSVGRPEEESAGCGCPGSQDGGGNSWLTSKIKAIIFIVVMVAAVGVAVSSVFREKSGDSVGDTDRAAQSLCGSTLDSLLSLNQVAADQDFVFILLPAAGAEENERAAGVIDRASETISRRGVRVANFTIEPSNPDYQKLIDAGGIESLPAVLATGKGCGSEIVTGEITEERLLKAYDSASRTADGGRRSCRPSSCH